MDARSSRAGLVRWMAAAMCAAVILAPSTLRAGGGPQNVFLVVNSRSWASLSIANHFVALRRLPAANILYLDWGGDPQRTDIATFREQILQPVLGAISQRKLSDHIDYIVYSSDFPTAIDAGGEFKDVSLPAALDPVGSLTGTTYLSARLPTGESDFMEFNANHYAHLPGKAGAASVSRGFRSWYGWDKHGDLLEAGGRSYMLSVMLGVTSGRGNSVSSVVDYLTRARESDGKRPPGTIYFASNKDIRSTTREPNMRAAVSELAQLGVRGEIFQGVLPDRRPDVMGLMTGAADFDWRTSHSTILPGAICEHLTSFGGALEQNAGQTPFTQFLRYGAAGSSGTVVEPFAMQAKFPLPQLHVHYARGCSLAESFYRSVVMPRQLLIVGDPLCRPWARIPEVFVDGLTADSRVRGELPMTPSVAMSDGLGVDRLKWFLDGVMIAKTRPGERLTLNTLRLPDGAHELRVVATENSPVESQGESILPFEVDNTPADLKLSVDAAGPVHWGEPLKITIDVVGGSGATVFCSSRVIGKIEGEHGELSIDPKSLGLGPIVLHASSNDGETPLLSNRVALEVLPSMPLPPTVLEPGSQLLPGFLVQAGDQPAKPVDNTVQYEWLEKAGVAMGQTFTLSGAFRVRTDDVYQFEVRPSGPLRMTVDGATVFDSSGKAGGLHYVPVSLAAGLHRLEVNGTAGSPPRLYLGFGGRGTATLNGDVLRRIVPDSGT